MKIEQLVDNLIEKIKKLVTSETSKLEKELQEVRKSFADFKLETVQKNHEFQINMMQKQFDLKTNPQDVAIYTDFDLDFDEDTRLLTVKSETINGEKIEKSIKLPTLIYRGVYSDAEIYEKGDCVTQGGSMWVCKKDTIFKPGTEDGKEDWQLSVKKGRDAKESK